VGGTDRTYQQVLLPLEDQRIFKQVFFQKSKVLIRAGPAARKVALAPLLRKAPPLG
jgi:hypothetical protein